MKFEYICLLLSIFCGMYLKNEWSVLSIFQLRSIVNFWKKIWHVCFKVHQFWEGRKDLTNFPLDFTFTKKTYKSPWRFCQTFVVFSDYMTFILLHSEQHIFLIVVRKWNWSSKYGVCINFLTKVLYIHCFVKKNGFQKEENTPENEWSFVLLMLLFFFFLFSRKINECKGLEEFLSKAAVAA